MFWLWYSLDDYFEQVDAFLEEKAESVFTFVPDLDYNGSYTDEVANGKIFVDGVP